MDDKLTIEEVADIVEGEGLGYAVTDYMNSDSIEDEELAKLWEEASIAMRKIQEILEPYMP